MIGSFRRLLRGASGEAQPAAAPDWKRQGNDFLAQGQLAEAVRCYRAAVDADAQDAAARLNLGFALLEQQSIEEARQWLQEVLRLQPSHHEAHFLLARAARAQGALEAAMQSYAEAVRHDPAFELARTEGCEVCLALGRRELDAGRAEEAQRWIEQALALQPGHAQALLDLGEALLRAGREDEALAAYDTAFDAFPDAADREFARGNLLQSLRRLPEALEAFRRAAALRPGFVEALVNAGGVLQAQKRFAQAVQAYDEALSHDPGNAPAHWSRSMCLLVQGQFDEGWREAEWRFAATGAKRLATSRPQWTGAEPLAGKTLLVHAEQGFGDTLQFCRYVPLLAERGANVIVGVHAPLEKLVQTLPGSYRLLETGEPIPHHDYHCPLLSLPLAFGTTLGSIPARVPYLASRPQLVAKWRERLGDGKGQRVGIAWSGNPTHVNDHNRSLPLELLLPIAGAATELVSVQKDVRAADAAALRSGSVAHYGDLLTDFEETAALVECMDVVITVDTSLAHLAGALGKPVWILLPFSPDWRWLLDRADSPWYPTARLFRQENPGDWAGVVAAVREALQKP